MGIIMLRIEKINENRLVRLHPRDGGKQVMFNSQNFQGVSVDIFVALDAMDVSAPYCITRKLNINIAIDPSAWNTTAFFEYFTQGNSTETNPFKSKALSKTSKCEIHGDENTGLIAHNHLMALLQPTDLITSKETSQPCAFDVDGVRYVYDSIGVASNKSYGAVDNRQHNTFEGHSSHFEIKFRRQSHGACPYEYLYLNIHLTKDAKNIFGKKEVCERLRQGIRLFYSELGVLNTKGASNPLQTNLKSSLNVTLANYDSSQFSCIHPTSLDVLKRYNDAKKYKAPSHELSLWALVTNKSKTLSQSMRSDTRLTQPKQQPAKSLSSTVLQEEDFPSLPTSSRI